MTDTTGAQQGTSSDQEQKAGMDFPSWLATHRRARLAAELSEKFAELVEAVETTGRKGSLGLTVTVSSQPGVDGAFVIVDNVTVKVPPPDRGKAMYFSDGQGGLSDAPKDQTSFDFSGGAK